jgi:hypothetical protein
MRECPYVLRSQLWGFMKHIAQMFVPVVFLGLAATSAQADPIKITFDKPPCAALGGGEYPGACYAGSGVILSSNMNGGRFTSPQIAIAPDDHATSAPNVARAATGFTDIQGNFVAPGGQPGVTDLVSWNVTGSRPGQDPWEAFLLGNTGPVDSRFHASVLATVMGFSDQLVTFSRPDRDIAGFFMAIGTELQGVDNLAFNAPVAAVAASATPEPSTLLLMATGAALVVRRRRRDAAAD